MSQIGITRITFRNTDNINTDKDYKYEINNVYSTVKIRS